MTYQQLFNEYVQPSIVKYRDSVRMDLIKYQRGSTKKSSTPQIQKVFEYEALRDNVNSLLNYEPPEPQNVIQETIKAKYKDKFDLYESKLEEAKRKYKLELEKIDKEHELKINTAKLAVDKYKNNFDNSIKDIHEMYDKMIEEQPRIEEIAKIYGIGATRLNTGNDTTTLADLRQLLNISQYTVTLMGSNSKILHSILRLTYLPADKKFEDSTMDLIFSLVYFICFIFIVYVLKPYSMAVVGLIYIIATICNLLKIRQRVELLSITYGILDTVNPNSFLEKDEEFNALKEKVINIENEDLSSIKSILKDDLDFELEEIKNKYDPSNELAEENNDYIRYLPQIEKELAKTVNNCKRNITEITIEQKRRRDEVKKELEDLVSRFKPLGKEASSSKVLGLDFKIALCSFEGNPIAEAIMKFNLKNIVFLYKDEQDFYDQIDHAKLLLVNVLCSVKPMELVIDIMDSNFLGKDFSEFMITGTLSELVKVHTSEHEKLLKTYYSRAESDIRKLGKKTIQDFNENAQKTKAISLRYNLIIMVSYEKDYYKDERFRAFAEYSANTGNIIWLFQSTKIEKKEDIVYLEDLKKRMYVSSSSYSIDGLYSRNWGELEAYKYSIELGNSCMVTIEDQFNNGPRDIITFKEYADRYIPKEKYWTWTTQEGIELPFGYQDGDPSKGRSIMLCDGPVHGLAIGATGAGKSAFANFLFGTLYLKYPPEELIVMMIDFKNIEFPMYFNTGVVPHVKIISGTRDGEYAVSIFEYLLEELNERTMLFQKYNVQNILDYNKIARNKPELLRDGDAICPRLLVYIDEFTTMYDGVPPKQIAKIENLIKQMANLARFCGCHMFFQTQNFSGTMSKAIMEQFSLRVCLRVAADAAQSIIGNTLPAFLPKNGQCYTNESMGGDQKTTKRWTLPFLSGDFMREYIPWLADWADNGTLDGKKHINRRPPYYNEDAKVTKEDFDSLFEKYPRLTGKSEYFPKDIKYFNANDEEISREIYLDSYKRTFILGDRTTFSNKNVLPSNFILTRDFAENIIASAENTGDLLNIINLYIENIKKKGFSFVVNVQDSDFVKLLDINNRVEEDYIPFLSREIPASDLIDAFEELKESREEDDEPFFIILCNWDIMPRIGINPDSRLMERFSKLIRESAKVDVHYILASKYINPIADLVSSCNHRMGGFSSVAREYTKLFDDAVNIKEFFAQYKAGANTAKVKLYQFPVKGTVSAKEMVIR